MHGTTCNSSIERTLNIMEQRMEQKEAEFEAAIAAMTTTMETTKYWTDKTIASLHDELEAVESVSTHEQRTG